MLTAQTTKSQLPLKLRLPLFERIQQQQQHFSGQPIKNEPQMGNYLVTVALKQENTHQMWKYITHKWLGLTATPTTSPETSVP